MKILFVTGNAGKVREAVAILAPLGIEVVQEKSDADEIQDKDAGAVSEHKAREAFARLRKPLIVEDTALHIAGLNGYPGAFVKHFVESIGRQGIVDCVKGKDPSAEGVCAISYCDGKGKIRTFRGSVKGRISCSVHEGGYDFGWDPIFIPDIPGGRKNEKTFAEMGMDEKNRISNRMRAFEKLAQWLKGNSK
ncbi:MAG: RdgB/HAM1 family non-canonical purine NTP pyrophosphatase [Candidatus Aenigmatarchaeota archaeon]